MPKRHSPRPGPRASAHTPLHERIRRHLAAAGLLECAWPAPSSLLPLIKDIEAGEDRNVIGRLLEALPLAIPRDIGTAIRRSINEVLREVQAGKATPGLVQSISSTSASSSMRRLYGERHPEHVMKVLRLPIEIDPVDIDGMFHCLVLDIEALPKHVEQAVRLGRFPTRRHVEVVMARDKAVNVVKAAAICQAAMLEAELAQHRPGRRQAESMVAGL